jgi:hypothetical protein
MTLTTFSSLFARAIDGAPKKAHLCYGLAVLGALARAQWHPGQNTNSCHWAETALDIELYVHYIIHWNSEFAASMF